MKPIVIGGSASGTMSSAALFHTVAQRWQKRTARLFAPYRPEMHYMRGPGPKSRPKHGLSEGAL